ncbi:beta-xylosidase [Adhaeribacter aerolatus]|uniref:Beta-xylosidase n=1 Tax=Adhaeribacter aerolatus TaxID=670289 RepID=A0A512AVX4_9BACT|nr:glycoside hydrolase family 43 protein [Adhaeribacter aerolatus]GEO03855.1 beta-xylosidase [Adhaeribacter aerolatus]
MTINIFAKSCSSAGLKYLQFFIWLFFILCCSGQATWAQVKTDNTSSDIYLADPTIFYHKGQYYLYGTGGANANLGFTVYTSRDLKSWAGPIGVNAGYALRKGDAFGEQGFWAPQVFYYRNQFYMAYTANEQIAIATSSSPLGPFTQTKKQPLTAPVKQIDPFVFIDDDGRKYLYHVRLNQGNRLFVAEMTDDLSAIKPETLKECLTAVEPWENTAKAPWPVAEGPSILKHKNLYYFVYSTNDFRNPDYAVGYAVSKSPYGPWEKYTGNPIISRNNLGQNGTGHGDFVKDKKGNLTYVLHTHFSATKVGPRKTAIVNIRFEKDKATGTDKLVADEKSFYFLQFQAKEVGSR